MGIISYITFLQNSGGESKGPPIHTHTYCMNMASLLILTLLMFLQGGNNDRQDPIASQHLQKEQRELH